MKYLKAVLTLISALVLIAAFASGTLACTGVYVGKKVSADGTTLIARSEDCHPCFAPKKTEIVKSSDEKGRVVKQVTNKFEYKLPDHTYAYYGIPNTELREKEEGRFDAGVMNEKGLSATATVTGYICEEAKSADPYDIDGLAEGSISGIIGACAATPKEAIELIASIIDEYGSKESNILMAANDKEAWYMEIYTGHQYAAVRLPEDMVAGFGNEFMLGTLDDFEETITSRDLFTLPNKKGFAVYTSDGEMDISATYAGANRLNDYANMRTWYAHKTFAPSSAGEYTTLTRYPLLYKPDHKVSLNEVMKLFGSRFEGTQYCPEETGSEKTRVIGTETQTHVHTMQVYYNMPDEYNSVCWLSLAQAECSVFVPVFKGITRHIPEYTYDLKEDKMTDKSASCVFKKLDTLCAVDRLLYKDNVVGYWDKVQKQLISSAGSIMKNAGKMDKKDVPEYLTKYDVKYERAAVDDARTLSEDVITAMAYNTDTLAYRFSYPTLYMSDQRTEKRKTEVSLNEKDISKKYGIDN